MPLNRLFAYLFRNEAGDVQFLYLVDDRWPVKYTLTQKMEMEPFTEVNLNLEQGRSKHYLTHKGPECEISAKYQKEYQVSHGCLESKTEEIFAIACLGKKFLFQSEISTFSLIIRLLYFQKYRNFVGSRSCPI